MDAIKENEAVVLFENRARSTRPDFTVGERNARPSLLSAVSWRDFRWPSSSPRPGRGPGPGDHRGAIEEPGAGLGSRSAQPAERHRTLEAAVDWSYRLLDEDSRRLFRFLSVFANGFTIGAAESVSDAADPIELVSNLVNSSLMIWDSDADRYRLLEPIRAFARNRLEEASEADAAAARHLSWCARLADSLKSGPEAPDVYEVFNRELDNFRAALTWAATHASSDGPRLAEAVRDPIQPPGAAGADGSDALWEVSVWADRSYFDRMEAEGIEFPDSAPDRTFQLTAEVVSIGRSSPARGIRPEIDLSSPPIDTGISHEHALLVRHGRSGWAVVDPGSANGVFLNESTDTLPLNKITSLADGDRIHLGAWTTITVRRVGGSAPR